MKEAVFKCKFAAAYMMEHFGVSIMVDDGKEALQCYGGGVSFISDRDNCMCPGRILVDPEGAWPFEPQKGDVVMIEKRPGELFPGIMLEDEVTEGYRIHTILSRDGKPFIMPEVN